MAATESWQRAEVSGTRKAFPIQKPQVLVSLIKRAGRRLMMVGSRAFTGGVDEEELIHHITDISDKGDVHLYASADTVKKFSSYDFEPHSYGSILEVAKKLGDEGWEGFDGGGNYELTLLLGLPYYFGWLILSGLKNFTPKLTTVSLEPYYQPNARWSLPNQTIEAWIKFLEEVVAGL